MKNKKLTAVKPPEELPCKYAPTIEQRLNTVRKTLVLMASVSPGSGDVSAEELIEVMSEHAASAAEKLYWIAELPALVVTLPAPTDDDLDRAIPPDRTIYPSENKARQLDAVIRAHMTANLAKVGVR